MCLQQNTTDVFCLTWTMRLHYRGKFKSHFLWKS